MKRGSNMQGKEKSLERLQKVFLFCLPHVYKIQEDGCKKIHYKHSFLLIQDRKDFLKGMGLGMIADQLAELKLGELLDTPPPGLDEAVAIGKVRPKILLLLRA